MARILVLRFEDNDSAEVFSRNSHVSKQLGFTVEAMYFASNGKVCECGGRRNLKDWARSKKFGVPVCTSCRRLSPFWPQGLRVRLDHALGRNLLEDS